MGEQIRPELADQASDTVGNDVSVSFDVPFREPDSESLPAVPPAQELPEINLEAVQRIIRAQRNGQPLGDTHHYRPPPPR